MAQAVPVASRIRQELKQTVCAPGETLREILSERSISQADLAGRMGRPQKTISEIMNGKASITPETALELELVLSIPADTPACGRKLARQKSS